MEKQQKAGLSTESIKALYFDELSIQSVTYTLYRVNELKDRFYYVVDENAHPTLYPSTTTIINTELKPGFGLIEWLKSRTKEQAEFERDSRANYGTFMHKACSDLVVQERVNFVDLKNELYEICKNKYSSFFDSWYNEIQKDVRSFASFWQERKCRLLASEIGLKHDDGFAGCLDLVVEMDFNKRRVLAIVDLKSGKGGASYENHEIQLHAYKELWNYNFPALPVEMLFNLTFTDWRSKPSYRLTNQSEKKSAKKWDHLLEMWKIDNDQEEVVINSYSDSISLNDDIMKTFSQEKLSELIKEKHKAKKQ